MLASRWLLLVTLAAVVSPLPAGELIVRRHTTRPPCTHAIPDQDYQWGARSRPQIVVSRTALLLQRNTVETEETLDLLAGLPRAEWTQEQTETIQPDDKAKVVVVERRSVGTKAERDEASVLRSSSERQEVEILPPAARPATAPVQASRRVRQAEVTSALPRAADAGRKRTIKLYQLEQAELAIDQCAISDVALQLDNTGHWVLSLRGDQNRRVEPPAEAVFNPWAHIKRNEFVLQLRCLGAFRNEPQEVAPRAGRPVLAVIEVQPFWVENGQPRYLRIPGYQPEIATYFPLIDRVELEFFYR